VRIYAARQVGKSWGLGGSYVERGLAQPGCTSLFFGINGVAVRGNFWESVLLPLLRKYGVSHSADQTRMLVTLGNGSRIFCMGVDDLAHVQNVLGNRFKGALIGVDEMQSQRPVAVRALLESILPPTITPETTLVLSGTMPEVAGGYWHSEASKDSYEKHGWGRVRLCEPMPTGLTLEREWVHLEAHLETVNPHTPEAPAVLVAHLRANKLSWFDPRIQRDWAGIEAYDPNARSYYFRREVNAYKATAPAWLSGLVVPSGDVVAAEPLPGIDTFSGSIDPGGGDPCGVEVWGWSSKGDPRIVQQVFSWVSTRDHRHSQGQMFTVAGIANQHYKTDHWRIDSGAKQDLDHLRHDFGLPVVKAVDRSQFEASLRRCNSLLLDGTIQVIDDPKNPLLVDYLSAQLDPDALARGQHKWSANYHPTASENGRYLLAAYWPEAPQVAKAKPAAQDPFDKVMIKHRERAKREAERGWRRT
jgi:hypothetical protein